jgi:hypothetical protein
MTAVLDDELTDLRRANAELQQKLDEAFAVLDEAQVHKVAKAEIIEVINSSPGDPASGFEAMLEMIAVDSRVGEFTESTIRLPRSPHATGTGAAT